MPLLKMEGPGISGKSNSALEHAIQIPLINFQQVFMKVKQFVVGAKGAMKFS
jgi:hypothetical protein